MPYKISLFRMFFLLCKLNDSNWVTTLSAALLVSVLFCTYFLNCSLLAVYTFSSLQVSWFKSWYHIIIIIIIYIELILFCNVPTLWNCSHIFPSLHIFFVQMETLQSNVVSGHTSFLCLIIVAIITFWPHILQKLEYQPDVVGQLYLFMLKTNCLQ
jgi:hypothetical protein